MSDKEKMFYEIVACCRCGDGHPLSSFSPGAKVIKLFFILTEGVDNKLECLFLASLSSLIKCLQVRQKHTRGTFEGKLLALPLNIRLSWKSLTGKTL